MWSLTFLLGFAILLASFYGPATVVHASLKLQDPGHLVLEPLDTNRSGSNSSLALGVAALGLFFTTDAGRDDAPLIQWTSEAWPSEYLERLGSEGMPTLITCGPREPLEIDASTSTAFLVDSSELDEIALETKIQLISDSDTERVFTWTTFADDPTGMLRVPEWSEDGVGCVCRGDQVETFSVSREQSAMVMVDAADAAIVPGARQLFWVEYAPQSGVWKTLSLKTLDTEGSRFLQYTFDNSASLFTRAFVSGADIWRATATDTADQLVLNRRIVTERGAFLLLGNRGKIRIDGETAKEFNGPFFAIIEPWGAYRSQFEVSCAVMSVAIGSTCECPLIWLYDRDTSNYGSAKLAADNAVGVLRVENADYPFEEYDVVALTLSSTVLRSRRSSPGEYIAAGDTSQITLNGEPLVERTFWMIMPADVRNVVFALFSALLAATLAAFVTAIARKGGGN